MIHTRQYDFNDKILFFRMMLRARLKIGDLQHVLGEQMKLPKFIRIRLSFKLENMKFPMSFPKCKKKF